MPPRKRKNPWPKALKRMVATAFKSTARLGMGGLIRTLAPTPARKKLASGRASRAKKKPARLLAGDLSSGVFISTAGARRYCLFKPHGVRATERLPLLVMLHGCAQDAAALASSTRMDRIAASKRFLILYAEQDRLANAQLCWNWYGTRSGRAVREADSIAATIAHLCATQPIDPGRIAVAGLSAGASMAALLAIRFPERFRAVVMHSGIAPGVAHSASSALKAMRGVPMNAPALAKGPFLPALLVIHGSKDHVVAPINGVDAAQRWAAQSGAKPDTPRVVQRGGRYSSTMTDYRIPGRLVVTHCQVNGLAHAWSGGAAGHPYSDPKGPSASAMIWTFVAKQFLSSAR